MTTLVGQTVSHYKILSQLGAGGMGVVYKAQDLTLDRTVALKFLPPTLTTQEPEQARFLQEARAASALNHPNICAIHTLGEHEGMLFIDMELVDGATLREKLAGRGLPLQQAVEYGIQICDALQEAHTCGIVHRDVKTDNIMVTSRNTIKVMDFGLAKLKGSLKLTRSTSTVGTLGYMAPEQINQGSVDPRCDIFSFGVVLYEMLTGRLPFRGEHEAAMIYSILNEEPEPIEKFLPAVPSELVHILMRALEKNPDERYQSAQEVLIELRRLKKQTGKITRPGGEIRGTEVREAPEMAEHQRRGRGGRVVMIAGAVAVCAGIGAISYLLISKGTPRLNPHPTFRTLEIPFTEINYPTLSRDGNWIAFGAAYAEQRWAVYFMNVAKGPPRRLTSDSLTVVACTDISPDGSEVLFEAQQAGGTYGLFSVPSSGGPSRLVAREVNIGKWRPDGRRVGYTRYIGPRKRGFLTATADGRDERTEFVDSVRQYAGNYSYDWSPDGQSVAWLRPYPGSSEVVIRDLVSGMERVLTSYGYPLDEIVWAPNDQIFFTATMGGNPNIWTVPARGGEPVQVTRGSGPDLGTRSSADARRFLYIERRTVNHLYSVDLAGGTPRQLTFDSQPWATPSFSPDGKRIVFDMGSPDLLSPRSQVFVMNSDGTERSQLTAGEDYCFNPTWSPDGRRIAYASRGMKDHWDSARVYIVEALNPGTPRLVGVGIQGVWVDSERLTVLGLWYSYLYSIRDMRRIEEYPDRTWQFPLPGSALSLVCDFREDRRGWWLESRGSAARRNLIPDMSGQALPSASLRYLLYEDQKGEEWRISLPGGKRFRLPRALDGLNPWAGGYQLSHDDTRAVFLRGSMDSRLVLVENLFE